MSHKNAKLTMRSRLAIVRGFAQGELAMATTYIAYQLTLWGVSYWLAPRI